MSTTKPWGGGVGAWAAEAEAAEAEEQRAAAAAPADIESFPSLKDAASTKTKKKKSSTMSLSEFYSASSSSTTSRGLTPDEMQRLPTGPRERSQEELEFNRGFRSYGLGGGMSGRRDEGAGGGRRPFGGFDDDIQRRGGSRSSDLEQMPSRADEVDNWGSMKKPLGPSFASEGGRHDRYESLGGRGGPSRADETDNWAAGKKSLPLPSRQSGFGSGFRDSASSDSDRWVRGAQTQLPPNGDRERPRLVLEPRKADVVSAPTESGKTKPSPFGSARPREEILAEKGMDWRRLDAEIEIKKTSRPTSSQSSRPSSAQSNRTQSPTRQPGAAETVPKPRSKVNPFGDAKPREVVLQEQGKNWKKMDFELEHRGVDRPDTEEEKRMKEEISVLDGLLKKENKTDENGEHEQVSPEGVDNLRKKKENLEMELEQLARGLDDKVRFGQKVNERRPGSGSGRPSSQSGRSEDARSMEFTERPRSRGGGADTWSRSGDDHRSYNLGNRNADRSRSRERW